MEYMGGGNLQDEVERWGLEGNRLADVLMDVLMGLSKIHEQGYIHRDIKGVNIMMSADGTAKIGK